MEEITMNFKKISAVAASAALAASMMSLSASAADWSKTGYADDDPTTVTIVSTNADGVTFTQQVAGGSCKARLTLSEILENPDDVSKVYSGSWDITYTGLSSLTGTEIGWLGGGAYCATTNSAGFGLAPAEYNEDGTTVWDDTQTVQDSFKYLLPSQVPADASEAEFVFMDWSGQDLVANGIELTVSNFHIYDKDGNEIAQKAYAGDSAAAEEAPAETEAAAEDTAAVEDTAAEETTEVAAPAADDTTTSTATGNASAAAIASVMAVAAAAAVAAKKRK